MFKKCFYLNYALNFVVFNIYQPFRLQPIIALLLPISANEQLYAVLPFASAEQGKLSYTEKKVTIYYLIRVVYILHFCNGSLFFRVGTGHPIDLVQVLITIDHVFVTLWIFIGYDCIFCLNSIRFGYSIFFCLP